METFGEALMKLLKHFEAKSFLRSSNIDLVRHLAFSACHGEHQHDELPCLVFPSASSSLSLRGLKFKSELIAYLKHIEPW